jgi:hypothetical protein
MAWAPGCSPPERPVHLWTTNGGSAYFPHPHLARGKRFLWGGVSLTQAVARPGPARARLDRDGPLAQVGAKAAEATPKVLLVVFLTTLLLPIFFHVGDLRLSPYRVFLLVVFIPLLLRLVSGGAGRIVLGDVFMGLHCLWIGVALFANHGAERLAFIGITVVELFGGYLAGRVLIRSAADYQAFFRYFAVALLVLLPFAVFEMLTGRMLISEILRPVVSTFPKVLMGDMRMGFHRAQGVLEHSILWGVFCSIGIANLFYIYRESLAKRLFLSGLATGMTFTSLSAAPLQSVTLQFAMIGWGWVTRNAWWTLVILAAIGYVVIDALSNRTPVMIMIDYLTFNSHNAWIRIHIWNFGTAEVWRNPIFGIGLGDWQRPSWLPSSVDNFWLVTAMRYGLPGLLLLALAIATNLFSIIRQKLPDEFAHYRVAYVIAAIGLLMTLATVHVWGATSVFVMFYIGAGSWLFGAAATAAPQAEEVQATRRAYARRERGGSGAAVSAEGPRDLHRGPRRDPEARFARRRAAYGRRRV